MEQGSSVADTQKEPAVVPVPARPWRPLAPLQHFWQQQFARPLRRVDQESKRFLASKASAEADRKVMIVLVTVAVTLTIQRFLPVGYVLARGLEFLAKLGGGSVLMPLSVRIDEANQTPIGRLLFWCLACILTYFIIPSLVIRGLLRERLSDYGLKLRGAFAGFWIYGFLLAVMLPLVFLASADQHFQLMYPFYPVPSGEALWPNFWCWEIMYAFQFFALEFFFRGFIVHGTKHRFGVYAVFVMIVPYCMIHFQKPVQEAFASILAGVILGLMSLKTRSIWMGAVLHVSVALSMDFSALLRKGFFS